MKVEELRAKVAAAEDKVEKCKRTIERHQAQLQKKLAAGVTGYEIEFKQDDIKGATSKLRDAEGILANWRGKLAKAEEKQAFLNRNTPQVLLDFLTQWKNLAFQWHVKRYNDYLVMRDTLNAEAKREAYALFQTTPDAQDYAQRGIAPDKAFEYWYSRPTKVKENYLKEKGLDWKTIKQRTEGFAGGTVMKMTTYYNENERLAWLNKLLEQEKEAKLLDLINRIKDVVGDINSAEYLHIAPNGCINGRVDGTKTSAFVETITAGGWNIQCFHFRVLVKPIR